MAKSKENTDPKEPGEGWMEPGEYQVRKATQIWSHDDTGHDLTVEEQLFCRSYIVDRNPVAALRRLNYDMPADALKRMADKHLRNPEVQGCVEILAKRIMENLEITADRVNRKYAAIAFADVRQVMEFDHTGVHLLHSKYWTEDQAALIAGIKSGQYGVEVKFADRMKALDVLAKQTGAVDDEAVQMRLAAEAGAAHAIAKIFQTAERMRQPEPLPLSATEDGPTTVN